MIRFTLKEDTCYNGNIHLLQFGKCKVTNASWGYCSPDCNRNNTQILMEVEEKTYAEDLNCTNR